MKLQGKVACITGAGRGFGRAAAMAMAKEGAALVLVSRTASELKETAETIQARGGGRALFFSADITRSDAVQDLVREAVSCYGRIDILMNNAAVTGPIKPLCEMEEHEWNSVLAANLSAAFVASRIVVPYMKMQGGGKIINVTSGLGTIVIPFFGPYSVTKAGLIHFTRMLAEELKDSNIQVNGLDPGMMDTRMQADVRARGPEVLGRESYHRFMSAQKSGVLKSPEQPARLAVFLASAASDTITGQNGTERHYLQYGYSC